MTPEQEYQLGTNFLNYIYDEFLPTTDLPPEELQGLHKHIERISIRHSYLEGLISSERKKYTR